MYLATDIVVKLYFQLLSSHIFLSSSCPVASEYAYQMMVPTDPGKP